MGKQYCEDFHSKGVSSRFNILNNFYRTILALAKMGKQLKVNRWQSYNRRDLYLNVWRRLATV